MIMERVGVGISINELPTLRLAEDQLVALVAGIIEAGKLADCGCESADDSLCSAVYLVGAAKKVTSLGGKT